MLLEWDAVPSALTRTYGSPPPQLCQRIRPSSTRAGAAIVPNRGLSRSNGRLAVALALRHPLTALNSSQSTELARGGIYLSGPRANNSMPTSENQGDEAPHYRVWGLDNVAYGPVELPVLTNWVLDERVTADTWVFAEENQAWLKAAQMPELTIFFERRSRATDATPAGSIARSEGIKIGSLRRIKILADMEEKQLESFVQFMEVVAVRQ